MKICVMGAGVGGLTTAHKLAKEGHQVHVYEKNPDVGGQARSRFTSEGEHSEYCLHVCTNTCNSLIALLKEIPTEDGTMFDRLKRVEQFAFGIGDEFIIELNSPVSTSLLTISRILSKLKLKLTPRDLVKMAAFHFFIRSASVERLQKYDDISWKDLMKSVSPDLKRIAIDHVGLQFGQDPFLMNALGIFNFGRPTKRACDSDRIYYYRFNGPINQQWLDPWAEHIKSLGVAFHMNTTIKEIHCENGEIKEVIIEELDGKEEHLQYDYYINGLDVQGFAQALSGASEVKEKMFTLSHKSNQFQVGMSISFQEKITFGGPSLVFFPGTPWQILFANESAFWDVPLSQEKSPPGEVLATAIGLWDTKGILYDKTAKECTKEEFVREIWAQMKQTPSLLKHFKTNTGLTLNDIHYSSYNLWYSYSYNHEIGTMETTEPKYGNNKGTWSLSPPTHQEEFKNLVHATAYTKTDMMSATIDAAVEAGSRAANFINCGQPKADVERFRYPGWFWGSVQSFDRLLYKWGLPNIAEVLLNWI